MTHILTEAQWQAVVELYGAAFDMHRAPHSGEDSLNQAGRLLQATAVMDDLFELPVFGGDPGGAA